MDTMSADCERGEIGHKSPADTGAPGILRVELSPDLSDASRALGSRNTKCAGYRPPRTVSRPSEFPSERQASSLAAAPWGKVFW